MLTVGGMRVYKLLDRTYLSCMLGETRGQVDSCLAQSCVVLAAVTSHILSKFAEIYVT